MTSYNRYNQGTARGREPGAEQRPEQVLGHVDEEPSKEASRIMYLKQLRTRIESGEYEVDTHAVAAAIVERLETLHERLERGRVYDRDHSSVEVVESQ